MQATALICDAQQRFTLDPVTLPDPGPGEIAVAALYSGVSIGTEFALIRNKISWGPYPLCTGYMAVGLVTHVGTDVAGYRVGDKVYYRTNAPMRRVSDGAAVTSVTGMHCSHAVMNPGGTHGAALCPPGAPDDATSMFVLPAVGLEGVDMANPRMGTRVLVYGAGLIGLAVVAAAAERGAVVTAVDPDPAARRRALRFGADFVLDPATDDVAAHFKTDDPATGGADMTFESTGIPACLEPAIKLTRRRGVFVWQGNYGDAPVAFPFNAAHIRRLTMFFPCDDGGPACRRAVVKQMASGTLPWGEVISHRIPCADAPKVFDAINQGDRRYAGVVIRWR